MTTEEAADEIKSEADCGQYEEGHEMWLKWKAGELRLHQGTASQFYLTDPRWYSPDPIGWCGSQTTCADQENGYCYNRYPCTGCMRLDDHNRPADTKTRRDFVSAMRNIGINLKE